MLKAIAGITKVIGMSAIPSGIAPSGTMGANGALNLGANVLPQIYGPTGTSLGIWLNFIAGAVYSGSVAGSYWTVMTSTSVGTVYNNILPIPGSLTPPASPTAVVDAGPGAYAGAATIQSLAGTTVTGLSMGNDGALRIFPRWSYSNSAVVKTPSTLFDTTTVLASARTTTVTDTDFILISNRGVQNTQLCQNAAIPTVAGASAFTVSAIDTTKDKNITFKGTVASAGADFIILEGFVIELLITSPALFDIQ